MIGSWESSVLATGPDGESGGRVGLGPYVMRLARLGGGPSASCVRLKCGMTKECQQWQRF